MDRYANEGGDLKSTSGEDPIVLEWENAVPDHSDAEGNFDIHVSGRTGAGNRFIARLNVSFVKVNGEITVGTPSDAFLQVKQGALALSSLSVGANGGTLLVTYTPPPALPPALTLRMFVRGEGTGTN